jgi:hypothetical protein
MSINLFDRSQRNFFKKFHFPAPHQRRAPLSVLRAAPSGSRERGSGSAMCYARVQNETRLHH